VGVKPEVLALIWGPIRLLLVWTAVTAAMVEIGDALPQFVEAAKIFSDREKLKDVLALFYRDILDFYIITLEFFSLSRKL
jgi:hypothetical protein